MSMNFLPPGQAEGRGDLTGLVELYQQVNGYLIRANRQLRESSKLTATIEQAQTRLNARLADLQLQQQDIHEKLLTDFDNDSLRAEAAQLDEEISRLQQVLEASADQLNIARQQTLIDQFRQMKADHAKLQKDAETAQGKTNKLKAEYEAANKDSRRAWERVNDQKLGLNKVRNDLKRAGLSEDQINNV